MSATCLILLLLQLVYPIVYGLDRPEIQLARNFINVEGCPFLEISGSNMDIIQSLFSSDLGVPLVLVMQNEENFAYFQKSLCRAVFIKSEYSLELAKIEEMTHGSISSLLIVSGDDHSEIETMNVTRPVYYIEKN